MDIDSLISEINDLCIAKGLILDKRFNVSIEKNIDYATYEITIRVEEFK